MKFKVGNIAYFYNQSNKDYSWRLKPYQKVTIHDIGFDRKGEMYYSIKISDSEYSSWYFEGDMLSEQEIRKYKILKINEEFTY